MEACLTMRRIRMSSFGCRRDVAGEGKHTLEGGVNARSCRGRWLVTSRNKNLPQRIRRQLPWYTRRARSSPTEHPSRLVSRMMPKCFRSLRLPTRPSRYRLNRRWLLNNPKSVRLAHHQLIRITARSGPTRRFYEGASFSVICCSVVSPKAMTRP